MVRKLALAVALALGTVSVPAQALGLGDLSSGSGLNQNFKGDIALLSVATEDVDGVRVKLADTDAFEQAGVERPYYLSRLRFAAIVSESGKPVIRVTSDFPIREPFMNFLVEVNWPKGRLVREYTVLLDPPTTTRRRPPTIQPAQTPAQTAPVAQVPTAQAASTTPARTAPASRPETTATTASADQYGPVQANETAWGIAESVRPSGVTIHQMMMALLAANPQAFADNNINRLRRGQILRVPTSEEARRLSAAQARSAFQAQYQDWLAQKSVPAPAAEPAPLPPVVETAPVDAPSAEEESADQLKIATARPLGEGEAGAGDDAATSAASEELESRLLVARENAETSRQEAEALRGRLDDLESRLADMQKLLSLKDDQLAQLQDRMTAQAEAEAAAESKVADAAEAAGEAKPDVTAPVDAADLAEPVAPEPAVEAVPTVVEAEVEAVPSDAAVVPGPDSVAAEMEAASETVEPAAAEVAAAAEDYRIPDIPPQVDADAVLAGLASEAAEAAADTAPAVEPAEPVADAVETAPAAVTPPASVAPATPTADSEAPAPAAADATAADDAAGSGEYEAILTLLRNNIVPVGIGSILLMMLIGLIATRGRRADSSRYAAAAPSSAHREAVPPGGGAALGTAGAGLGVDAAAATLAGATADDLQQEIGERMVEGEVLPADLTEADLNALQEETGEVDPVSEADVYIAYGRFQHAEQLLQQALEQDPGRVALKHKLLEVHYATRNGEAFTALAEEMAGAGQDTADPTAWARAQDMGRELAPDHSLFEAAEGPASDLAELGEQKSGSAHTVDDDTLSLNELDISELTSAYDDDASAAGSSLGGGVDQSSEVTITLDSESLLASEPEQSPEMTAGDSTEVPPSISLEDLESLEFEMPAAESDSGAKPADSESLSESFDLDSMLAEATDGGDSSLDLTSDFSADDLQAELDELSDLSVLEPELDSGAADGGEESPLGLVSEDTGASSAERGLDEPISLDEAFDLDEPTEGISALSTEPEPDAGADEDVATKLDLARAYVEMGDSDGARGILEEVVSEGSDAQRSEAKDLLAKLG